MKNQKKLIVIATIIALLICAALMTCAMADEKIYTSPTFKLPAEKIQEWTESQPEEEVPAEEQPAEGTPEEGEPEDEWLDDDPRGDEEDGEPTAETPAEGTEGETPAEGTEGETPAAGTEPQGEEGEVVGETETKAPERTVTIRSSQGDVVTEGEIIYLTSKLKGFDGLDIAYQWQVDRGDGAGWVDVEGANRSKHMFVADKETIQYSWRLIVTVMGEE
ncbi:MAG: hypothetical protein ABS897_12480 [Eubacteriales bacterium]